LNQADRSFLTPLRPIQATRSLANTKSLREARSKKSISRARIIGFVAVVQSILFLAHWFVYETWIAFHVSAVSHEVSRLQVTAALLSVSFVSASVLAFRYSNRWVRLFYKIAATWLGFFNFFFVAAVVSWLVYFGSQLMGASVGRPIIVDAVFGVAILVSVYGLLNAWWIRVNRVTVKLRNLPASWRGRTAAVVSDIHLGHVNGSGFLSRIVAMLARLRPDIIFIAGDFYDGSKVNADQLAKPLRGLSAKFGAYFAAGNHEEFSDSTKYLDALERAGIRVLNNEKVILDGLQIVGVHHRDSAVPTHFRSILERAGLDRNQASILLSHAPHGLPIAEQAGISLQLSGHTHGGQVFPFTWLTSRIFGEYTYGLNRFGELMVYTSSGAGTWGPPMRVGRRPEVVLIQFE
jgi:predicted MPP superfamily phosphohydrolase